MKSSFLKHCVVLRSGFLNQFSYITGGVFRSIFFPAERLFCSIVLRSDAFSSRFHHRFCKLGSFFLVIFVVRSKYILLCGSDSFVSWSSLWHEFRTEWGVSVAVERGSSSFTGLLWRAGAYPTFHAIPSPRVVLDLGERGPCTW